MKRLLAVMLAALVLGLVGAPAHAEKHKDEELGYSFVHPKKWDPMPLAAGSDFLVAKFVCPRQFEWQDKSSWGFLKPYIEVVVIPLSAADDKGAKVTKSGDQVNIDRGVSYSNLKEYLELSTKRIGGFYFSAEEETEVNGMKCIQYEVTVDKLVQGERKVLGWAYYTEDAIYGFVGQIFSIHEKKLRPDLERAFKSFKHFPRTGALPGGVRTGDDVTYEDEGDDKDEDLTDAERKKRRDDLTNRTLKRIEKDLPDGWIIVKGKHYIAVSHADKKYTKEVLSHADAVREWMDDNLGFVGSGYVGKLIIRICKDYEEYSAYWDTRDWSAGSPEVVTYEKSGGWSDGEMQHLNKTLWRRWVKEKNESLRWAAPRFISDGLMETIAYARVRRNRVEFPPDKSDELTLKGWHKNGTLLEARTFFTLTSEEFFADQNSWRQNRFFIHYLLVGPGSKNKKYKTILADYIKNLVVLVDEEQSAEPEATARDEPTSEEEEDAMYRERAQEWRKVERARLDRLLHETFEGWTDKDWNRLNALYWKAVT